VRAVGAQLGVETLLEGSVRKADDRLRVTVQRIEVATGYHRWSQRFDRTIDDVFAILVARDQATRAAADGAEATSDGSDAGATNHDANDEPPTDGPSREAAA
jgi:adenylate cyclase